MTRVSASLVLLGVAFCAPTLCGLTLHVSPDGRDDGDGSALRPFRTAVAARDALRAAKRQGVVRQAEIVFASGTHAWDLTLELSEADSGTADAPVVWRAAMPGHVFLDGGYRVLAWRKLTENDAFARDQLSPSAFGNVAVADIRDAGAEALRAQRRFGGAVENGAETVADLYFDGAPLTLAREPDDSFLMTGEVRDRASFAAGRTDFARWQREPEPLACGYWHWMFLDETASVAAFTDDGRITMKAEIFDNPFYRTIVAGRPYFLVNALTALSRPGEWFLDRRTGLLYVWPPQPGGEYVFSAWARPFVTVSKAHDLVFRGLGFRHGQTHGLVAREAARLRIEDCQFVRLGGRALVLEPVRDTTVSHCRLADLGHGGVRLVAGDRRTLAPGGCRIADCEISTPNRHRRTYAPCVDLDGVGTTLEHCHLHDCLSSAIRMDGNDMTVACNLIERAVLESDDQGALDTYGYVSFQGNRIVGNVWRDIGRASFSNRVSGGLAAIRLDDNICSVLIASNRFERIRSGTFGAINVNRGCRNTIENNLFIDCENARGAAIWMELCGQGDWNNWIDGRGYARSKWGEDMTSEVYRRRYPGIGNFRRWPTEDPRNYVRRNLVVGAGHVAKGSFWHQPVQILDSLTGTNAVVASAGEIATAVARIGFRPLPPLSEIGPRDMMSDTSTQTTRKGKPE